MDIEKKIWKSEQPLTADRLSETQVIVTSGVGHLDIDAIACCVAHSELLHHLDVANAVVSTAPFNCSVTPEIRDWGYEVLRPDRTSVDFLTGKRFHVLDVSDPEYFDSFVARGKVEAVYDHHYGFDHIWQARTVRATIEPIGACATLVWENYVRQGLQDSISTTSANLLYAAILSNTLNHTATVDTPRDRSATIDLKRRISLPKDWHTSYFSDVENAVLKDISSAINRDKKQVEAGGDLYWIAQIEMWHGSLVLQEEVIEKMIATLPPVKRIARSFVNVVDIENGRNIIVARNQALLQHLKSRYHGRIIRKNVLEIGRPILRKEILKDLIQGALNIN